MRGCARIILVCVVVTPCLAGAQEPVWEPLVVDDGATTLIEMDRTQIRYRDGQLSGWLRLSFAEPAQGRIQLFLSAVALYAFDCAGQRYAVIRMTTYSEPLGEGEVIDRWDSAPSHWQWRTVRRGSADERMQGIACAQAPATILSMPMATSPQ